MRPELSLGVRILAVLGFGTVGAKVGMFGLILDANSAMAGANLSIGEKIKGVFNGKLCFRVARLLILANGKTPLTLLAPVRMQAAWM